MTRPNRIEWQTWLLVVAVYGFWALGVALWSTLPFWVGATWLIIAACWHMSLQHELIHGHPTRSKAVNRLIGLAPLAVWYPYDLYRSSHLAHHRNELLTEPGIDPESNYIDAADYEKLPAWVRPLWTAQRTALGRMLVGPVLLNVSTWLDIVRKPVRGDYSEIGIWTQHFALLGLLLFALDKYAGISPATYLVAVGYPALGVAMLRSFYEHRPSALPAHRVVINEAGFFWRLLFLNNNYHSVHHENSSVPWYELRRTYLADREGYLARNGGFLVCGYARLFKHFAWTPIDSPVHPMASGSASPSASPASSTASS